MTIIKLWGNCKFDAITHLWGNCRTNARLMKQSRDCMEGYFELTLIFDQIT